MRPRLSNLTIVAILATLPQFHSQRRGQAPPMSEIVSEIISTGGRSLEKEDEFELWYSARKGGAGGILAVKQACYFQYVFGRAILPKYKAELKFHNEERCFAELKVKVDRKKKLLFMMESWRDGESLAPLTENVEALAKHPAGAYLLVFSANPPGQTEGRLGLIDGLSGVGNRTDVHRFLTKSTQGEDREFWIGCWQAAGG
jgi:hypothetical protein